MRVAANEVRTPREIVAHSISGGWTIFQNADAILAALADAGFVIAPREPTTAMIDAAYNAWRDESWVASWRAALAQDETEDHT